MHIRTIQTADLAALKTILDETQLFPSDMLADMIAGFLAGQTAEKWLTCEVDGAAVGFCYAVPEDMTDGAWNMLAITVRPQQQGIGCGAALVAAMEQKLRAENARILIVDTSGTDAFKQVRKFYRNMGYTQEARIRDFWAKGDDKIIFWKSLDT